MIGLGGYTQPALNKRKPAFRGHRGILLVAAAPRNCRQPPTCRETGGRV
jgi:hypothetical protein